MNFLQFMMANRQQVLDLTLEHITLAGVATLLAALVGIPLGILITRVPQLSKPVLGGANIIQTIPSLALFGFLLPAPWIGERGRPACDSGARALCAVAADSQYLRGHSGRRSGGGRGGTRHGIDRSAIALSGGVAAGFGSHCRGSANRDGALDWTGNDCGSDRRGRTRRIYFSRTGHGEQPGDSGGSGSGGAAGALRRLCARTTGAATGVAAFEIVV